MSPHDTLTRDERARFWARLASVESLDAISRAERSKLLRILVAIFAEIWGYPDAATMEEERGRADQEYARAFEREEVVREPVFLFDQIAGHLDDAHAVARATLLPMLRGEHVPVSMVLHDIWSIDENGRFVEASRLAQRPMDPQTGLQASLARVLRGSTHRFGLCPQCGAVFVRVRRQRYCSPNCNAKALAESRRESKAQYMRLYRKRQQRSRSAKKK